MSSTSNVYNIKLATIEKNPIAWSKEDWDEYKSMHILIFLYNLLFYIHFIGMLRKVRVPHSQPHLPSERSHAITVLSTVI